jgi:hypothetical protein
VPIGVPGELHVGGDGLARGYLNGPELTAEKFVANPFSARLGDRLYRTGDLTRYRADGAIQFLGRLDQQVKIHGFRIEPGEIEVALGQHPSVREAVVVRREDQPGLERLVAYVVPSAKPEPSVDELRSFLKRSLPEYMVPAAFVALDALPLTANGKLDRGSLPAPDIDRSDVDACYVAPRTPTEETLVNIWAQVLGLDQVSIHESFFDLGGDSILSMQVVVRARRAGLDLHPTHLFQHDTVAELASVVKIIPSHEPPTMPNDAPLLNLSQRQLDRILARVSGGEEPGLQ